MKIEDIIESLNQHIENKRKSSNSTLTGHLILQKVTLPHPTFKVYKTIRYTLWFINNRKKDKVLNSEYIVRMSESSGDKIIEDTEINFVKELFSWMESDSYKSIIG